MKIQIDENEKEYKLYVKELQQTIPEWKPSSELLDYRDKLRKMSRNTDLILQEKALDKKIT